MGKWDKKSLKLRPDHVWNAKPGYKVFVADRGAVRFDVPASWVIVPEGSSIKFHDRQPPDDDCTLQLSLFRLPPRDWSGLPLGPVLLDIIGKDGRDVLYCGELHEIKRSGHEIAWTEIKFLDANEAREAFSRTCLARKSNIQILLTFDFWASHAERMTAEWDAILSSLRLALTIEDPTLGHAGRG